MFILLRPVLCVVTFFFLIFIQIGIFYFLLQSVSVVAFYTGQSQWMTIVNLKSWNPNSKEPRKLSLSKLSCLPPRSLRLAWRTPYQMKKETHVLGVPFLDCANSTSWRLLPMHFCIYVFFTISQTSPYYHRHQLDIDLPRLHLKNSTKTGNPSKLVLLRL